MQHYFMHRVEQYLHTKGRTAIGWGEVVKGGLSDSMLVMSWLSRAAGITAAKHGNNAIMVPRGFCYFDYPQGGELPKAIWMLPLPLRKVYRFDPVPHGLTEAESTHIIGGEGTAVDGVCPHRGTGHAPADAAHGRAVRGAVDQEGS